MLAGRDDDAVSGDEQALVRVAWDEEMQERLETLDLAAQRVLEGGHDVATDRIVQRHLGLWAHVRDAIAVAYESRVYDSSGQRGRPFVEVARSSLGVAHGEPDWPSWGPRELRSR